MSYSNEELGNPKKALKKASREARKKIIPVLKNLVASGQLHSNEMSVVSIDFHRSFTSDDIGEVNALICCYA